MEAVYFSCLEFWRISICVGMYLLWSRHSLSQLPLGPLAKGKMCSLQALYMPTQVVYCAHDKTEHLEIIFCASIAGSLLLLRVSATKSTAVLGCCAHRQQLQVK